MRLMMVVMLTTTWHKESNVLDKMQWGALEVRDDEIALLRGG